MTILVKKSNMKPHKSNFLNSIILIGFGVWGYFDTQSGTAFIQVVIGVILLLCNNGLKNENKIASHIAVLLTLIILIALIGMRLPKSFDSGGVGLFRVIVMIITSLFATITFIKSFIDARK